MRTEHIFLQQQAFTDFQRNFDKDSLVIKQVKLLGNLDKGNVRFNEKAIENSVPLFNNLHVYVDHKKQEFFEEGGVRSTYDLVATAQGARYNSNNITVVGDIHLADTKQVKDELIPRLEAFNNSIGMSIVAIADVEQDLETNELFATNIHEILSVDIVTRPSTVDGLFNSRQVILNNDEKQKYLNSRLSDKKIQEVKKPMKTLKEFEAEHPELFKLFASEIRTQFEKENKELSTKKELSEKIVHLEQTLQTKDTLIDQLTVKEKKLRLDMYRKKVLEESELPDYLLTDTFKHNIENAENEKQVDELVADRKQIHASVTQEYTNAEKPLFDENKKPEIPSDKDVETERTKIFN